MFACAKQAQRSSPYRRRGAVPAVHRGTPFIPAARRSAPYFPATRRARRTSQRRAGAHRYFCGTGVPHSFGARGRTIHPSGNGCQTSRGSGRMGSGFRALPEGCGTGGEPPFVQAIATRPDGEIDARHGSCGPRHPFLLIRAVARTSPSPLGCEGLELPAYRSGSESGGRERALGRSRPLSRQMVALASPRRRRVTISIAVPPSRASRPRITRSGGSSPPVAGSAERRTTASSESRPGSSGSPNVW